MSTFLPAVGLLVFIVIFKAHGEDQWSRSCEIDVSRRVDCGGHIGGPVTAESCVRRGCCWKPLHHGSKEPWCFIPAQVGRCKISDRVGCPGNTKYTCERNGCCWVPTSQPGPWCYYGSYRETLTCDVNWNDRTPCEGRSKESCRSKKCCWKPDVNVAVKSWCYRPRYFGPPRTSTKGNSITRSPNPTVKTSSFEVFSTTRLGKTSSIPKQPSPPSKRSTRLSKTNSVPVVEQTTRFEGTHFTRKETLAPEKLTTSPERKNSASVQRTTLLRKTKAFPKQTSAPMRRTTTLENTKLLPDRTIIADNRTTLKSGTHEEIAQQNLSKSRTNNTD